ncbi:MULTISPECIES: NAD(P)-dependent alcohol dehydrogenase [unclassified Rathayibacter]|uniref:NAD(P)-dependent alcohol dehydrogenase n=1 Tax=unclassified Rathayibacter TaxID=2609250 RepID=UPI00070062D5|nr:MULTISPECIES: NAD(P)-dependent alcohol dehydrogenase [unclassified Rathayibacter]KQQ03619.1 alcohol dehydrogenase [Rathayibacter sp. Leaf294]KQS12075.1 alcohol dehydrogenase [Rathayibacter sp. Leaf185]
MDTIALLSPRPGSPLAPTAVRRRPLRPDDVEIRVTHCGVCHTDLHALDSTDDAGFPLVPGHEFVGEVVAIGDAVTDLRAGDAVAVGNIVDSCGTCRLCRAGQENFCEEFPTLTYGGRDRLDGSPTLGAFATTYVARERFVYRRPESLDPAAVAPLMCAGVTVWEPLRAAGVGAGTRLGVVGLGGLGHLAVRLGRALGAEVTVITTSPAKSDDARELGASRVVVSSTEEQMRAARGTLDVILDTVAVEHALAPLLGLLDLDGTLYSLGHLGPIAIETMDLLVGRKRLSSGGSAGRRSTQELLDFCGEHGIVADVEVVGADDIEDALARLRRNDVRYRFVLDTATLGAAI